VVLLPLFFPACKFFESQVQRLVGFLTRPVTGNNAHDHTGNSEEQHYEYDGLYHSSVPFVWPRYRAIAIALRNMPVIIHTISIISMPIFQVVLLPRSK